MNKNKNRARISEWTVRPLNPSSDWEVSDTSESKNDEASTEIPSHSCETSNCSVEEKMDDKEFASWVSRKWNLVEFNGTRPVSERKDEWVSFIEQFERIIAVRKLSSSQKLQALRIHAGALLNNIIKLQIERGVITGEEKYELVLRDLGSYFDETCDARQERFKFREMKMRNDESFVDFSLRCETQLKYCHFEKERADEELSEVLIKRSIPEISKHLLRNALTLQNNVFAIIKQGTHLDNIRRDELENKEKEELTKPIMAVGVERRSQNYNNSRGRFVPFNRSDRGNQERPRNWVPKQRGGMNSKDSECGKCAGFHRLGDCPARYRRCNKCNRYGHYVRCCRSTITNDRMEQKNNEVKAVNQVKTEAKRCLKFSSDEED